MAGSNSTTRGVPRMVMQGQQAMVAPLSAGQIPTIQYSTGNAKALADFSRTLFQMSSNFEDQLDDQAAAEGASAGAVAGASGDFELQNYGTIRGRAYNKAALETFATTMDTASVSKLAELQSQFWNDPDGLKRAWDDYTRGNQEVIAARDPAQAAAYQNRATVRGIPAIEQAKDTAYKLTRDQAEAALVENEAAIRAEIKANAADLFSENPDRSRAAANAIGQVQQDYMRIYSATDPTTGKPLYSQEEKAKALAAFKDMTMTNATLSWFDEQPNKAEAYLRITSGEFKFKVNASNDQVPILYRNYGKRNLPLKKEVAQQMQAAAAATGDGLGVWVQSGGQSSREEFAAGTATSNGYTGSTRHVHGGAGDIKLTRNGQPLPFNENRALYVQFAKNLASAGVTGIGVDEAKGYIHAGGGAKAAWGYRGGANGSQYLPEDFRVAINEGWANPIANIAPKVSEFSVSDSLSPTAFNGLDAEMRARISFANQQVDRERTAETARITAQQNATNFEFTTRLYVAGQNDPLTGKPIPPLTRDDIMEATRLGRLKPDDGNALLKGLVTEHPQKSDDATYRDITNRIYAGEDVTQLLRSVGDKLSRSDLMELYGKNKTVVIDANGDMNSDQKFYYDQLKDVLRGGAGPLASIDEGRQARMAAALSEYRTRILDPENKLPPDVIMNEIADRANSNTLKLSEDKVRSMVPPRFSVMQPGTMRLDLQKTAQGMMQARQNNLISEAEYRKLQQDLINWKNAQEEADAAATARKNK